MNKVSQFQGEWRFLSNFWPSEVTYAGVTYPTVENAYCAAKTDDPTKRAEYENCSPGMAKRLGRQIPLCKNWDEYKRGVMLALVHQKFQRPDLRLKLDETADLYLSEGNTWGDTYWGIDLKTGKGLNNLGLILMTVREENRVAISGIPYR